MINISDIQKKSRAIYFQERRKQKYNINVLIDKEKGIALENHLKQTKQTKAEWIIKKIDQDTKK